MMRFRRCFAAMLLLVFAGSALAHKLAPSLLAIHEQADGSYTVTWKTPRFAATPVPLEPQLPAS